MQLEIENPILDGNNETTLSQPAAAGATTIYVNNTKGINANDYYVLDAPNTEKAEAVQVQSVTNSTTLVVSPLALSHSQGAMCQYTAVNQIMIYRSITGTAGPFTLLTTIDISWDQQNTQYFDVTGQSSYAYYTQLYNSYNSTVGVQSGIITGAGYDPNSFFLMKQRARNLLKDYYADFISDDELGIWINEKYNKMHQIAIMMDQLYITKATSNITVVGSQQEYPLPSDFLEIKYLKVSVDGGVTFFPANVRSYDEVQNMQNSINQNFNAAPLTNAYGYPYVYAYVNNNNVGFWPLFSGVYQLVYYPIAQQLVADTDVPYLPLSNFTYMMVNYAVMRGYMKSGRADIATRVPIFKKEDEEDEAKLKEYLAYRQTQYPQDIKLLDRRYWDPIDTDMEDSNYL